VVFPGAHWEHVDPAKAGWSVAKLKAAEDCARTIDSAAVLVVQDGNVIATFGDGDKKLHIHSVRKSFMSALYGIAVANHKDRSRQVAGAVWDRRQAAVAHREGEAGHRTATADGTLGPLNQNRRPTSGLGAAAMRLILTKGCESIAGDWAKNSNSVIAANAWSCQRSGRATG